MLYNYLKVALRSLLRSKLTSFINIAGLGFALACAMLIYLYVRDELSYDRFNKNADRTYRVTRNFISRDGSVSLHLGHLAPPFGPLLKADFSEIEEEARTINWGILFALEENGERKMSFDEDNTFIAEPSIFKIFTIPFLKGNPGQALVRPFTMMLSDETAMKYFGTVDVVGKHLRADNAFDLEITGVFKALPDQSHWHPTILISFSTLENDNIYGREGLEHNWGNNSFSTYILVNDDFDARRIESLFPAFIDRHMESHDNGPKPSSWTNLFVQPLTSIHLHSHLDSEIEANGNINNVYTMAVIGIFIILIACFNFINLSTARATKRAKEVGLRKVVGAFRRQLVIQHLGESLLIAFMALTIAIILDSLSVGWLNSFTGKSLQLNLTNNATTTLAFLAFTVATGLVAGLYPAFVISRYKPALILKGHKATGGRATIRKGLVVAQFTISVILMIATTIILQQLRFVNNRDLGYARDQVVTLSYYGDELGDFDVFRNELMNSAVIRNVTRSSRIPTGRLLDSQGSYIQKGDTIAATDVVIKDVRIDPDFFDTYGIPIVAGRNFSKEIKSDDSLGFIINEAAVRMIGWANDEAVGKVFQNGHTKGQIVGVVRDFHFESLHEPIIPIVFHLQPHYNRISVRIAGSDMQAGIAQMEKTWKAFLPQRPFEYRFLSDIYQQLYNTEQKESELFLIFSGLAILIASLGLFGLATYNTMQRVKEIGIRKVLGASVPNILGLLSREIVILILIANVIAWPVAWYAMNRWLNNFAYRVDMNLTVYLLAAVLAVLIALLTVSIQTIRAALANPASTLRYE